MQSVGLSPALVVEDDLPTQRRLRRILVEVSASEDVAVAGSIAQARAMLEEKDFRLAIIDIGLPDGSGVDLIAWLHEHQPTVTTLVVSAWGHEQVVIAALCAGASGYLLKERDDVELRAWMQTVARGGAPIDPAVARCILSRLPTAPNTPPAPELTTTTAAVATVAREATTHEIASNAPAANEEFPPHDLALVSGSIALSHREGEILDLVSRGYSNREIAGLMAISRYTVEDYTKSIYRKLCVNSRTAAVFEAKALGLLH
ncbi:response regulator transcription factor [Lysobacter fragariae]